jgi:tetratricopeptide (TPR) repeat protein
MGYWISAIVAALVAIAGGYLYLTNATPVVVHLTPQSSATVPLAGALLVAFVFGGFTVGTVAAAGWMRRRWRAWQQRRHAGREARREATTARARELVWTGDYAQARSVLLHRPHELPDDAARLAILAESHLQEGDAASARRVLDEMGQSVGVDPHLLDLHASAAEGTGDLAGATIAVERALEARPGSPRLHRRLRDLYAAQQRWADAIAQQQEVLDGIRAEDARDAEVRALRGLRYEAAMAEPDDRRAARQLLRLAKEAPAFTPAWMSAGERWVAAGRPPSARRAWVRGARHHPSAALLVRLEDHYGSNGNGDRMTEIERGHRRSHPDDVTLGLMFVRHLLSIGEIDEAARTLDALPTTAPRPLVSALRGALLRRRGDDGPAAGAFAEALGPGLGLTSNLRCTACSRDVAEWMARCPACREWNTIEAPADRAT